MCEYLHRNGRCPRQVVVAPPVKNGGKCCPSPEGPRFQCLRCLRRCNRRHGIEHHKFELVDFFVCEAFLGILIQLALGFSVVSCRCQVSAYPCVQESH